MKDLLHNTTRPDLGLPTLRSINLASFGRFLVGFDPDAPEESSGDADHDTGGTVGGLKNDGYIVGRPRGCLLSPQYFKFDLLQCL